MMDLPGNPPALLEEDLLHLRTLNRNLGAYRGLLQCLASWVRAHGGASISLLDVGTGCGDIPVALVEWGKRHGVPVRVVGLDPNPIAARLARTRTQDFPEISIVMGNAFEPPFRPPAFDFVLSSQVLHHFPDDEIVVLLRKWATLASKGVLVSDLVRHPLAYAGILLVTRLLTRNPMTRTDGPLSVRRALTLKEWDRLFHRAAVGPFDLKRLFPFRVFALIRHGQP